MNSPYFFYYSALLVAIVINRKSEVKTFLFFSLSTILLQMHKCQFKYLFHLFNLCAQKLQHVFSMEYHTDRFLLCCYIQNQCISMLQKTLRTLYHQRHSLSKYTERIGGNESLQRKSNDRKNFFLKRSSSHC